MTTVKAVRRFVRLGRMLAMQQREGPMVRLGKPGCILSVIATVLVSACAALLIRAQALSGTAALAIRAAAPVSDSQPQQAASEVSTLREYSNIVVVDVVVTDLQGNPIHGLSKDTFSLTEN